ncbi:MAG: carbon storage regulator [Clostridiales bacterium]|nr:carbon storage regulator [Clostridiales bacterium]
MLILQRRPGESIFIGDNIEIAVMAIEGGRARLAITAPADVTVLRSELVQAKEANRDSVMEQTALPELLDMLGDALPAEQGAHVALPRKPVISPRDLKTGKKTARIKQSKGGDSV